MIRALVFDCFGVLYIDPGLGFYERAIPRFSVLREDIRAIDRQYDYGFIDEREHSKAIADLTGLKYEDVRTHARGAPVRNDILLDFGQQLRPDVKIGMLSNMGESGLVHLFSKQECDTLFDSIVLSSDIGIVKPQKEIYEITANRLGIPLEECMMIDDRQQYVDGAKAAGMSALLFQDTQQCINKITAVLEARNA